MKKQSLSALAAAGLLAGGMSVTSASAADLGGNCCADLEERIAELEATTARKGNRKVSLTVSGWVAEQVMWWDDGEESNVYVGGIGTTIGTNVKFTGQATIVPGWSAGYVIHLEADGSDHLLGIDQDTDNGAGALADGATNYVQTLQSFWFIKSESLGKLSVGLQSQASDNTAILVDGSGSLIPANFVQFDYGGFEALGSGNSWIELTGCTDCNGIPLNAVRYDTPTFAGFSASASWGEDDFWDIALRYAGEFSGFKLAAAAAYSESTDIGTQGVDAAGEDTDFFQVGAYLQNVPTGLFVYGAYGEIDSNTGDVENEFWYVKAGIRQRWTPLGHTVLYGEYENFDNTANLSEVDLWGAGIVQEIDNAAMSLWLSYRHLSGDEVGSTVEDFDYVKGGALINF
ncbi:MAG: porin [Hyphomicrobium sp.]|uniref:porin n=1 Tax=Hyphomicrobium sp. TaxID=82 RepID=UPI003D09C285